MRQHAAGSEHRELRMRGRARGGAEDRDIFAARGIDEIVVERGLACGAFAAARHELFGRHQARVIVFAHAARIGIDDVPQRRRAVGQAQQFVDLFFVFGKDEFCLAVVEKVGGFFVEHVAIEAEAQAANRMRRDFGRDPVRPVVADDADDVAPRQAQFDHAEREILHAGVVVVPGEELPEAEVFFTQRDLLAELAGVQPQQFRIGVGLGDAGGVIHHAALSAGAGEGASSGSTSTSSSSPR